MDAFSFTGLFHHSKGSVKHTAVTRAQNSLVIRASGFSIEYDISKTLKKSCHQHLRWFELLITCLKGTYKSWQLNELSLLYVQWKLTCDQAFFFGERTPDRRLSENKILDSLGSSAVVKFIICEADELEGLKEQGCVLFGSTVSTPTGSVGWYGWCFSIKHFSNWNSPHASYNLRLPLLPFQPGLRMGGKIHRPNHPKTVFHL